MSYGRKKSPSGWRINGSRVYYAKGKKRTRKKTYRTKSAALKHKRRHRKRKNFW